MSKKKIHNSHGFEVSSQKLIHAGKILVDDKPLLEYSIAENDFLVVMVSRAAQRAPVPASVPASVPSTPASVPASVPSTPIQLPTPAPSSTSETSSTTPLLQTPSVIPTTDTPSTATTGDSDLVTGPAYEAAVSNLCEMGFSREEVVRAMRAAFNNADRAVEYLLSGIPAEPQTIPTRTPVSASPVPASGTPFSAANPSGASNAQTQDSPLAFLRSHPQFGMLKAVVQQNPSALPQILQTLAAQSPELLQVINQNQEEFLRMLNEPLSASDITPEMAAMMGGGNRGIQVTQEEKEAIDRLIDLGFDESAAVEAYLACDKNEAMAANYLFDNFDGTDPDNPTFGTDGEDPSA